MGESVSDGGESVSRALLQLAEGSIRRALIAEGFTVKGSAVEWMRKGQSDFAVTRIGVQSERGQHTIFLVDLRDGRGVVSVASGALAHAEGKLPANTPGVVFDGTKNLSELAQQIIPLIRRDADGAARQKKHR